jgi:hypothetical protein
MPIFWNNFIFHNFLCTVTATVRIKKPLFVPWDRKIKIKIKNLKIFKFTVTDLFYVIKVQFFALGSCYQ